MTTHFNYNRGDTLDDLTNVDMATMMKIIQEMADQPFARNATMSIFGSSPGFVFYYNKNNSNTNNAGTDNGNGNRCKGI